MAVVAAGVAVLVGQRLHPQEAQAGSELHQQSQAPRLGMQEVAVVEERQVVLPLQGLVAVMEGLLLDLLHALTVAVAVAVAV